MSNDKNINGDPNKNGNSGYLVVKIPQILVLLLVIVVFVAVLLVGTLFPEWLKDLQDDPDPSETPNEMVGNPTAQNREAFTEATSSTTTSLLPSVEIPLASETYTPTPTPTLTLVPTNKPLLSPTATTTPLACMIQITTNASAVRSGPGEVYNIIRHVSQSEAFAVVGISSDGDWIVIHDGENTGWVVGYSTDYSAHPCTDIPVVSDPPTPRPRHTPTATSQPVFPSATTPYVEPPHNTEIPPLPPVIPTTVPIVVTTPAPQQPSVNLGNWCATQYGSTDGGFHDISYQGGRCYGVSDVDGDTYSIGVNHDAVCQSIAGSNSHMDRVEGSTLYCSVP